MTGCAMNAFSCAYIIVKTLWYIHVVCHFLSGPGYI